MLESEGRSMKTEVFEKDLFNQCVAKNKLSSTFKPDLGSNICSNCNTPLISMRLDRSPHKGSGTLSSDDVFIFRGCPNCNSVSYAEIEFFRFAGKECNLKDYLLDRYF